MNTPDSDIPCTLGSADLAAQTSRWERLCHQALLEHALTEDGVRPEFRDGADVEAELHALVAVECECCAWATWTLSRGERSLLVHAHSTGDGMTVLHGLFQRR